MRFLKRTKLLAITALSAVSLACAAVAVSGAGAVASAAEPAGSIEFTIAGLGTDTVWGFGSSADRLMLDIVTEEDITFTSENVRVSATTSLTIDGVEFTWAVPAASFAQIYTGGRLHILLKHSEGISYNGSPWYAENYPGLASGEEHVIEFKKGMTIGAYKLANDFTVTITPDGKFLTDFDAAPDTEDIGGAQDNLTRSIVWLNGVEISHSNSAVSALIDGEEKKIDITTASGRLIVLLPYDICSKEGNHTVLIPKGSYVLNKETANLGLRFTQDIRLYVSNGVPYVLKEFTPAVQSDNVGGAQDHLSRYLINLNLLENGGSGDIAVRIDGTEKSTQIASTDEGRLMLLLPYEICSKEEAHEVILPVGSAVKKGAFAWMTDANFVIYTKNGKLYTEATPSVSVKIGGEEKTENAFSFEAGSEGSVVVEGIDFFGNVLQSLTAEGLDEALRNGKFVLREGEKISVYTVTATVADSVRGTSATRTFTVTVGDTLAPVITIPDDIRTQYNEGEALDLSGVSVSDNYDESAELIVTKPEGMETDGKLNIGTWTIKLSASDKAGNAAEEKTVTVTVKDVTPPTITIPDDIKTQYNEGEALDISGVSVSDNYDESAELTVTKPEGMETDGKLNIGTWTIKLSASDKAGNAAEEKTVTVTVKDVTPPTITIPGDIKTQYNEGEALDISGVSVSDNYDESAELTVTKPEGMETDGKLNIGTWTVKLSASDKAGNAAEEQEIVITVRENAPDDSSDSGSSSSSDDSSDSGSSSDSDSIQDSGNDRIPVSGGCGSRLGGGIAACGFLLLAFGCLFVKADGKRKGAGR